MTAGHYNEEPGAEREAVQRWENEGGKLWQHGYRFGSIGEGYQRHLDQAVTMGRLDTNEIAHGYRSLHPARRSVLAGGH